MSCYITYKGKNYTQEDFLDFLKSQIPTKTFTWARRAENSYEVSSKGDTRFSALNAKLKDGRTIEEAYQLDVKGYRAQGDNWRLGKGKAPLTSMTKEQTWQAYKNLWRQFLEENPTLEQDLRNKASGKVLTDMFASTDISQARALAELLNERKSSSSTLNNPAKSINEVKPGVAEIFQENPELASIGTQEQYSAYLNTIFPDSQVKDIVYHASSEKFENPYDNTVNKNYKEDNSVKIEILDTLELGSKHFEKMSEIRNLTNSIQDIENANKVDIYHSYHGTNKVNIDNNGNLILKPSLNFEGKTNSISFTQVPAVAEDYAMRKQGEYIIQINNSQIKDKYTIENTEEIAVNTEKELVIPKGQYKILKANTTISNQNRDIRNRVQKYYDYDNVGYAIRDAFEEQQYYEELLDVEEQAFNNPVSRQPKWYKNNNQRNRDAATIFLEEKKKQLGEDKYNKLLRTTPSREMRQHDENEKRLLKSLNIGDKVMFMTPSGKLEKVTVTNIDYNTGFISVNINGEIEEISTDSIIDNSNFAEEAFECK